jgi:YHS domain-containing protein
VGLDLEKDITVDIPKVGMVLDPVFKKEVDTCTAKYMSGYKGKIYYFCSVCSKKLFEEHPERYTHIIKI